MGGRQGRVGGSIEFKDIVMKDKNLMILESNSIGGLAFKNYIKKLKSMVFIKFNCCTEHNEWVYS